MKAFYRLSIYHLLLLLPLYATAQVRVAGKVVDDQTGEPLPSVSIYVRTDKGAITNFDGDFSMQLSPDDVMRFTYVGYEKRELRAGDCPEVVRLRPMTVTMGELTVRSGRTILDYVVARLNKEWKRPLTQKKQGNYFYRLSSIYSKRLELAESFIKARSAINLRNIHFMRGLRGQFSDRGFDISHMDSTNQHFLIELAPMTHESDFWNGTFIPFNDERYYHKLYDSQVETLASEDGDSIYRIQLTKNSEPSLHLPYLEGTLYVTQKKWRLLRFEGDMHDLQMKVVGGGRSYMLPIDIHVNIVYKLKRRSTRVDHMTLQIKQDFITTRSILFNVDDDVKFRRLRGKSVERNMLRSIDEAGYDSTLWAVSNIVLRTNEEELAAFRDSTGFMPNLADRRLDPVLLNVRRMLFDGEAVVPLRLTSKSASKGDEEELHR